MGTFIEPQLDISQRLDVPSECGLSKFVSAADIQQLVDLCRPGDKIGFIWVSASSPDVASYPEFKNFIWIDLSGGFFPYPFRIYNWEMNSWDVTRPADGSITGKVLADQSVNVIKLQPNSGTAGQVIMVNADSTKFVYVFAQDAIPDKKLEIGKLKVPADTPEQSYLMHTANGVLAFATLTSTQISALILDGTLPISKLAIPAGTEGQSIKVSGGKWVFYTPSTGSGGPAYTIPDPTSNQLNMMLDVSAAHTYQLTTLDTKLNLIHPGLAAYKMMPVGTPIDIPASGATVPVDHGLSKVPTFLRAVMVCQSTHGPAAASPSPTGPTWTAGMEIDITAVMDDPGRPVLYAYADATKIYLSRISASSINMPIGPNYAPNGITTANWKVKFYAGVLV